MMKSILISALVVCSLFVSLEARHHHDKHHLHQMKADTGSTGIPGSTPSAAEGSPTSVDPSAASESTPAAAEGSTPSNPSADPSGASESTPSAAEGSPASASTPAAAEGSTDASATSESDDPTAIVGDPRTSTAAGEPVTDSTPCDSTTEAQSRHYHHNKHHHHGEKHHNHGNKHHQHHDDKHQHHGAKHHHHDDKHHHHENKHQ